MINMDHVALEIVKVLERLKFDSFPETFDYLKHLQKNEYFLTRSPHDIALEILNLDGQKPFPPYLIDFITELFLLEIREGNEDAMNDLGAQYYDGSRGFEQSFQKALRYYTMAAEMGNRAAQENLGYCYYYGRVGEPDYEKAFHFFALGAFDGHLISLYKIGDMYLNGLYVPQNEKEAFHIYMRCVETMTQEAQDRVAGPVYLRLGNLFLNGQGTEENPQTALVCYQKAELFLYSMVMNGDVMYKKSLLAAIAGQAKAREKILEKLPDKTWDFDN